MKRIALFLFFIALPIGTLRAEAPVTQPAPSHFAYTIPDDAVERRVHEGKGDRSDFSKFTYILHGMTVGHRAFHKGQKTFESSLLDGRNHGCARQWSEKTGVLLSETPYNHGRIDGDVRQWNDEGQLLGSCMLVDGTGELKYWEQDGQLHSSTHFVEGVRHGLYRAWSHGKLAKQAEYRDGRIVGPYPVWIDGKLRGADHYRLGKKHGVSTQWTERGGLSYGSPTFWIMGIQVSHDTFYKLAKDDPAFTDAAQTQPSMPTTAPTTSPLAAMIGSPPPADLPRCIPDNATRVGPELPEVVGKMAFKIDVQYMLDGKVVGVKFFNSEGVVIETPMRDGMKHGLQRTWNGGHLIEEVPYRNGLIDGTVRAWDESGALLGISVLVDGTGEYKTWWDIEVPHTSQMMVKGVAEGTHRFWRSGMLAEQSEYRNGKLEGPSTIWNAEAKPSKLISTANYHEGKLHGVFTERGKQPTFWINGDMVLQKDYLAACESDPTLPKFEPGK